MNKEVVVEIRVKYDDLMAMDELDVLSMYMGKTQTHIGRQVTQAIVEKIVPELKIPEIDKEKLAKDVYNKVLEIKAREVLDE